ncbi:MAG: TldD/PmbA family protein [Coprobacillus sp.]|nr:TldD/PmbA family protein [Coprobacillus sp.]
MISKTLAIEILNKALSTGGDYSEIYEEHSHTTSIRSEKDEIDSTSSSYLDGVGIRILKGDRSVYGYTNDLSKKGLLNLATTLSKSFNDRQIISVKELNKVNYKNRNKVVRSYDNVSQGEKLHLINIVIDEIKKNYDTRIVRYNVTFSTNRQQVTIYNSKSQYFTRHQEYATLVGALVGMDDKGFETATMIDRYQNDISSFKEDNIRKKTKDAIDRVIMLLGAKECPSGVMPVVIGNGFGGVLFHESCGHPLEASSIGLGISCFCGKDGKQIASPIVSAVDDSTIPHEWGSIDIDDEGNLGEKRQLIKDGILTGYMIDEFNGRKMGKSGNGACRRQNYTYSPTSRMSNTYIEAGDSTPEEIIRDTKLGLYAVSFLGGSVNPGTGEFNFSCSEAYIIRDGKVCEPVRGAILIGKGYEILKEIDMVGNDLALEGGVCGAASGWVNVNVGQPTLRLKHCLVGGRGGKLE